MLQVCVVVQRADIERNQIKFNGKRNSAETFGAAAATRRTLKQMMSAAQLASGQQGLCTDVSELPSVIEGASSSLDADYDLMQHRLGVGHFSEVRLALRRDTRQRVAVKVMAKCDAARVSRIQSEVVILRACTRLDHPNLMQLYDVYESKAEVHLVCEMLPNGSLLDVLQRDGALPEAFARVIVQQITSGLQALHANGIVHRDLKPENLLFG